MKVFLCVIVFVFSGFCQKPVVTSPTGISTGVPFYQVDDETHIKIRDIEYKANQLEIEIQQMKVKIEEDKQAETQFWKELQQVASRYAEAHSIDSTLYDFDATEIKFIQKKKSLADSK